MNGSKEGKQEEVTSLFSLLSTALRFHHIVMPSATYFCNGTKVGKKPSPQTPGGLIFREYL